MPGALFRFFIYGHFFLALCATGMAAQTFLLFNSHISFRFLGFVFCGTLCSYSFHWYLTPPVHSRSEKVRWVLAHKNVLLFLLLTSLAGCAFFIPLFQQRPLPFLGAAFVTFLYSAPKLPYRPFTWLKKIAVGKTIFLAVMWTFVTVALPFLYRDDQWTTAHYLFTANRFFFIYPICILFDYRDRESDRRDGVRSMITHFSEAGIDRLFWSCMVLFFASGLLLYSHSLSPWVLIPLLVPGLLLGLLYRPAKTNFSDVLYYFVLDGLMALSAPLLFLLPSH